MYLFSNSFKKACCVGILAASMASCRPMDVEPDQPVQATTGFQAIRPADSFTWSTSHNVLLIVTGLKAGADVVKPLQIQSPSGDVFYTRMHNIDNDLNLGILLPGHLDKVRVVYGEISKEVVITGGKIEFDFLTPAPPAGE